MERARVEATERDEIIALANEYNRLNRALQSKTQQLEALIAANGPSGDFPVDFDGVSNQRYSIDFQFTPGELVAQERSVTVAAGTIFRCSAIESFVRGVGTAEDTYSTEDVTVQATLPWNDRIQMFDFMWRIRDTGTDREWNERPQPSMFGSGGYWGPLWLPRRTIIGGGTTIFVEVNPFISASTPPSGSAFAGGSISQYVVSFSFIGHKVADHSAP